MYIFICNSYQQNTIHRKLSGEWVRGGVDFSMHKSNIQSSLQMKVFNLYLRVFINFKNLNIPIGGSDLVVAIAGGDFRVG